MEIADTRPGQQRLLLGASAAEDLLAEAEVRLYRARFEAVLGIHYDPDEYDHLVEVYRVAKRRADAVRVTAQAAADMYAAAWRGLAAPACGA
jgi:hypothetical protein